MPFYHNVVEPILPEAILDFHTHVWTRDQWLPSTPDLHGNTNEDSQKSNSANYMPLSAEYTVDSLLKDTLRMFPGKDYHTVLFGLPSLLVDLVKTNAYVEKYSQTPGLYPLFITGRSLLPVDELRMRIVEHGFFGFKVLLDWIGDDYADIDVKDMIGAAEMELANELGLIVLLHVPGAKRLADPRVQRSVREYARRYDNARIVLAHCGRCYIPAEMMKAIDSVRDLENVYFDTAMVMEPSVMRIVFDHIDSRRLLYGTDLPLAAMRGRRVYVTDHWVDLVLEGYPSSPFGVPTTNMNASFMAYEIALAINLAGEMAGLSRGKIDDVFFNNGVKLLRGVMNGRQWEAIENRCAAPKNIAEPTYTP